ncbi:hypothetical protein Smp_136610 [Schistosoma mansoni]|uniref:hypothetical protein n=1 Tax=Schistosoma mansoni TaxID=6183 RepID=UPI00022C878F|nr:hypothetical protein Smp_136610 [Schistosoma mansoni]|eukprot:XP_018647075.1 hypothetical protein Smp_136610 [Schistosoma mansoni]
MSLDQFHALPYVILNAPIALAGKKNVLYEDNVSHLRESKKYGWERCAITISVNNHFPD